MKKTTNNTIIHNQRRSMPVRRRCNPLDIRHDPLIGRGSHKHRPDLRMLQKCSFHLLWLDLSRNLKLRHLLRIDGYSILQK